MSSRSAKLTWVCTNTSHDFNDCNPEIVQGMAVEMASYWFLCSPVCDIVAMSVEANVEGILCLSNILLTVLHEKL